MSDILDEANRVLIDRAREAQRLFLVKAIQRRDNTYHLFEKQAADIKEVSKMSEEEFKMSDYCGNL